MIDLINIHSPAASGIILKMACLVKDGTLQGHKTITDFVSKAPSKILIIPAKELVQVIAKVMLIFLSLQLHL